MSPKKSIRHSLFNTLTPIINNKKNEHYKDIKKNVEENLSSNSYLEKLIEHATQTTPFYSKLTETSALNSFPVINKNIVKANFTAFQSSKFKTKKKRTVATSGSTGVPFKLYQNKDKIIRNSADTLYFSKLAGYNIGNELYYFRMWNAFEKKNLISRLILNIKPYEVLNLNEATFKDLVKSLRKNKSPKSFIGYASALEKLCKYLDKTNASPIDTNLQSIVAISESLSSYTRQATKKYFNTTAVSRYSNVENGIIAQQLPDSPYFIINSASYKVEILELNSNKPPKYGTRGRIVITDFFNYCMPLIRYDTGDIGIMEKQDGREVLTLIEGRKIDALTNTKGEIITSNLLLLINNYHELNQCQLIQKGNKEYVFKINISGKFEKEQKFIEEFRGYLGNDAVIKIQYVKEIPLLSSGKRRVMVNEMNSK